MNLEREAMRGRLTGLKEERNRLRLKADALCAGIRSGLNTALLDVYEIEIASCAQQMDDLVTTLGELAGVELRIERLEKELR